MPNHPQAPQAFEPESFEEYCERVDRNLRRRHLSGIGMALLLSLGLWALILWTLGQVL